MLRRLFLGYRRQRLWMLYIVIALIILNVYSVSKLIVNGRQMSHDTYEMFVTGKNDVIKIRLPFKIPILEEIKYMNRSCQCLQYVNGTVKITDIYVNNTSLYPGALAHVEPVNISMNSYGYPQLFTSLSQVRAQHKGCERFYNDTQQNFTVLHDVLQSTYVPHDNDVTLLTQLTVDRIDRLERLMGAWDGPFSVVIYIYKHCINTFMENIKHSNMSKRNDVLLHLAVPHKYLNHVAIDFPLSMLRNIAVRGARTDYVFYIDVDFVPNPGAYFNIRRWLCAYTVKHKNAYVIPGFDVKRLARDKREFMTHINSGEAYIFHVKSFPPGHTPTDVTRWMWSVTSYEIAYQDMFEPFCVFPRRILPAYPEINAGRQRDKVTQVRALHELGFKFIVLPDAFIMHIDHPRPPKGGQRDMLDCAKKVYAHMRTRLGANEHISGNYSVLNHQPKLETNFTIS